MHRGSETKFPWWYFLHTGDSGWPMRARFQQRAAATVYTNTSPSHSCAPDPVPPSSIPTPSTHLWSTSQTTTLLCLSFILRLFVLLHNLSLGRVHQLSGKHANIWKVTVKILRKCFCSISNIFCGIMVYNKTAAIRKIIYWILLKPHFWCLLQLTTVRPVWNFVEGIFGLNRLSEVLLRFWLNWKL